MSFAMRLDVLGVSSDGFSATQLPAAIAATKGIIDNWRGGGKKKRETKGEGGREEGRNMERSK